MSNNTHQELNTKFYERIKKAKEGCSIEEALSEFGIKVPPNRMISCLSPSHEDNTPSACVYDDHIYCFGCQWRVDAIDLVRNRKNCHFMDALIFIESEFLGLTDKEVSLPPKRDVPSYIGPDEDAQWAQKSALEAIYALLGKYTDEIISKHNIPFKYIDYFNRKMIDLQFLITRKVIGKDVLFLDHADSLGKRVIEKIKPLNHKKTSLYAYGDQLYWVNDNSHALLFPVWRIDKFDSTSEEVDTYPNAMRIRNIQSDTNNGFPKEVLMTGGRSGALNFPTYGFMGMNSGFDICREVVEGCKDLVVFLVEGATDYLAAQELVFKHFILGTEILKKIIILAVGGVNNAACTENIRMIKDCEHLIVAFDNDKAGDFACEQMFAMAIKSSIKTISRYTLPNGIKDLNELLISKKTEK